MYETVNQTNLYYEEFGNGNRVILACGQHFDYDKIGWPFDLAEEGFHVIVLTMRGYGKSSQIYENFEQNWYDIWADDIAAFATAKGISHFFYTGQSDGAGIGWHLCLRHPERLVGFAGLAAGPHSRSTWHGNDVRRQNIDAVSNPDVAEQLAQYQRQRIFHFSKKFKDDPILKKEFEEKAMKAYNWQLNKTPEEKLINPGITLPQFHTDKALLEALKNISFPVLLLNGMKDAMLPFSSTVPVMGVIPEAKVIYYQEATNFIQYDRRNDVRREIAVFAAEAFDKAGL